MKLKKAIVIPYFLTVCAMAQPQARHLERITYDKHRNKLIMYGGAANVNNRLIYFSKVHEWDETGWQEITAQGPGGRNASPLVYDPLRKVSFLFGGTYEDHEDFRIYFDVWSWDGVRWKQINSECPVKDPDAVYDPIANRILVYGEITNKKPGEYGSDHEYELWEFKADKWKKLSDDGPDVYPIMTFDEARNTLVIPSLEEDPAMWEWHGGQWKKIVCNKSCPPNRSRQAMTYHPIDKVIYMFGGRDSSREYLNDFWKWNGVEWRQIEPTVLPVQRASARFVFANDALLMYGGAIKGGILSNEIWQWKNNEWRKLQ
jgi:hypothetical protein